MKLSTRARYAVMAMGALAQKQEQETPVPLSKIAHDQELSLPYLEQIFHKMRLAGLVISTRGLSGGFLLARPAKDIKVYDIIAAVDSPVRMIRCEPNQKSGCQKKGVRCLTHDLWDSLGIVIRSFLSQISLDDVLHEKNLLHLCITHSEKGAHHHVP